MRALKTFQCIQIFAIIQTMNNLCKTFLTFLPPCVPSGCLSRILYSPEHCLIPLFFSILPTINLDHNHISFFFLPFIFPFILSFEEEGLRPRILRALSSLPPETLLAPPPDELSDPNLTLLPTCIQMFNI